MHYALGLALAAISLPCVADFISPPTNGSLHDFTDNQVYETGDEINIQLSTGFPRLNLYIYQEGDDSPTGSRQLLWANKTVHDYPMTWNINVSSFNLAPHGPSKGNVFYFWVFRGDIDNGSNFWSHYFNISQASTSSTSGTMPVTASGTSAGTGIASQAASAPATPTAAITSSSPETDFSTSVGLSDGEKAGIGIAAAFAALALLGLAFFLWRWRGRLNQQLNHASSEKILIDENSDVARQFPENPKPVGGSNTTEHAKVHKPAHELAEPSHIHEIENKRQDVQELPTW